MHNDDPATDRTVNMIGALALSLADRITEAACQAADLPENSASALVAIMNHPGDTVDALRRTLQLSHSGAVRLVDGLEAAGLVQRQRSGQDGRAVTLHPTPDGIARARQILSVRSAAIVPIIEGLKPAQIQALARIVQPMLAALTQGPDNARRTCRFCEEGVCRPQGCPVEQAATAGD